MGEHIFDQISKMRAQTLKYLEKLRMGEEAGLTFFMSKLGEPLRFFAFKITGDKGIAEEIVSESFLKLWQGRKKAVSLQAVKSFLYTVTRNAAYDFVGSSFNKQSFDGDDNLVQARPESFDVLTHIIHTEFIEQIVLELEKLPKQQAEIFRMSFFEGMKTKEICDALETTPNNVYFGRSKAVAFVRSQFRNKEVGAYLTLLFLTLM